MKSFKTLSVDSSSLRFHPKGKRAKRMKDVHAREVEVAVALSERLVELTVRVTWCRARRYLTPSSQNFFQILNCGVTGVQDETAPKTRGTGLFCVKRGE